MKYWHKVVESHLKESDKILRYLIHELEMGGEQATKKLALIRGEFAIIILSGEDTNWPITTSYFKQSL